MRVDAFDFELPKHLIADRPAVPRDSARLLVVGDQGLEDRDVRDLPNLLAPGDCLVVEPGERHAMRNPSRETDLQLTYFGIEL